MDAAPPARSILHVDMDAFFASVEIRDDPSLRGRAVIVGGAGRRGVVASCSYEARMFGVRSAMPSARARRLCPHAVFVAGRHDRYAAVSREIHAVFHRFTPLVEGISLDEAFLDVTGSQRLFGPAPRIGSDIRAAIWDELGLRCSVGIAPVKFLAKLASEAAKPSAGRSGIRRGEGVVMIRPGEELAFLHPHPIEALWGVGPATAARLRGLGVTTIGQLAAVPPEVLERTVGRAHGSHLADLSRGIDRREVEPDRESKSVSHEETYPEDRHERSVLGPDIVRMADSVAARLRRAGLAGRTVSIKIRFGDFTTRTRSRTHPQPVAEGPVIAASAAALLAAIDVSPGVRLLGVGVSNLITGDAAPDEQLTLDLGRDRTDRGPGSRPAGVDAAPDEPAPARSGPVPSAAWARASGAIDAVRDRFGADAVGPATLLGPGGIDVSPSDARWGPADDPG